MAINFKKLKKQIHFEKDDIRQPYWTFIPTEEQEFLSLFPVLYFSPLKENAH